MRKTLIAALVIAGAAGQVVAQQVKEDTITFALSGQKQTSVSNSKSTANAGLWSTLPPYYKTGTFKYTQKEMLKAIGAVLGRSYSSAAKLVLVQGELSGFFNMTPELRAAFEAPVVPASSDISKVNDNLAPGPEFVAPFASDWTPYELPVRLATGRHIEEVPPGYFTSGGWPPGHLQPWGQIFVKDPTGSVCDNVTYFFSITVEECYDCFYLNSFISDATFTFKAGDSSGPPCCSVPVNLTGSGKDRYYMTLSFDNTVNNPYLQLGHVAYLGIDGLVPFDDPVNNVDGIQPDGIQPYRDAISVNLGTFNPFVTRFTLNGIMTYTWSLKLLNKTDILPDFLGSGKYDANGYGFFGLYCALLTGNATFAEKSVNGTSTFCCFNVPWSDSWFGVGYNNIPGKLGGITGSDTPVNEKTSLSYHAEFYEDYETSIQHP